MPHVIHDIKLDFKDVLLRPKRSSLKSRAEVRQFLPLTMRIPPPKKKFSHFGKAGERKG